MSEFDDLLSHLRAAQTDGCGLNISRRIVQIRFERGEYPVQALEADLRELMAVSLWKEEKERRRG